MQNRGMFPYRRQGPKKRKNGQMRNKMRGPQKGLPNSARDLLPLLQPATKALAQVLAGRTQSSGQLGHAQAMLAHAERLLAERAHNRLNPAEREEFFEQLARLKLTLADADAEAEVRAAEEQVVKPPVRQVAHERLKEMALALSTPEGSARATGANGGSEAVEPDTEAEAPRAAETGTSESQPPSVDRVRDAPPGRLHLPRVSAEAAANAVASGAVEVGPRRRTRRSLKEPVAAPETKSTAAPEQAAAPQPAGVPDEQAPPAAAEAGEAAAKPVVRRPRKPKHKGVPDGWVIDEEGYVVPGPG